MPSVEYDLGFIQGGLSQLEDYLLSKELYWPPGANPPAGERPYPQLTIGNILLARSRLKGRTLSDGHSTELVKLDEQIDAVREKWQSAWRKKSEREFRQRVKLWRDFLEDYRADPSGNYKRYGYEVSRRVILHLLSQETIIHPPKEAEILHGLDARLRAILIPGEFVWDEELKSSFPSESYWYLYGKLKS